MPQGRHPIPCALQSVTASLFYPCIHTLPGIINPIVHSKSPDVIIKGHPLCQGVDSYYVLQSLAVSGPIFPGGGGRNQQAEEQDVIMMHYGYAYMP